METALVPEDQPSETSVYEAEFVPGGVDAECVLAEGRCRKDRMEVSHEGISVEV